MSCWRKSESACPTDPTNNPEREGDRLLSTAIYFSCRLITNLPYLPSLMSCKRTNSRLFSSRPIHLFFSKYWRGYAQQPHSALEVLLSTHRILRRAYPISVHPLTSRHSIPLLRIVDRLRFSQSQKRPADTRQTATKRKYIKTESSLNEALIITIKDECHIYFRRLSVFAGSLAAKDPTYLIACPGVNIVMITSPVAVVK